VRTVRVPADRKYSECHVWARPDEAGSFRVGITEVAASMLGDAVYLELPAAGVELLAGEPVGLIESSWVVFEVVSPLPGTVLEVNPAVSDSPEKATSDPYGEGWLLRLRVPDRTALDALLQSGEYDASQEREGD
jgi:glycine cleavage system H protein